MARRAVTAAKVPERSAYALLGASDVNSDPDADVLHFTVRDGDPGLAQRLATAYAEQFVAFRSEVNVAANDRALRSIRQQLARLRAEGGATSSLYAELVAKKQQLETLNALQGTDASLVRPADSAAQISPRPPMRTAALGLGLGIALAIALAILAEALDTRVKTIDEIESALQGLPILGRLPDPPKGSEDNVAMLMDPGGRYAKAVRMLRVGLATAEEGRQLVMVTSASAREGKSTTVANLAVALAQAGRRVVLCDLDARRPMIQTLFNLSPQAGLTDVVVGDARLEDALTSVPIRETSYWGRSDLRNGGHPGCARGADRGPHTNRSRRARRLQTSGRGSRTSGIGADVVLMDTPAMLSVGDAMTIARFADAVVVVVRLGLVRRSKLRELVRALTASPATPLGFVATGSMFGDRYDLDWYYHDPALLAEHRESIRR